MMFVCYLGDGVDVCVEFGELCWVEVELVVIVL